jgi:hypothetical protein
MIFKWTQRLYGVPALLHLADSKAVRDALTALEAVKPRFDFAPHAARERAIGPELAISNPSMAAIPRPALFQ